MRLGRYEAWSKIGTCFLATKIFKMKFKSSIRSRPPLPQHVVAKGGGRQYQKRLNFENRLNLETCSAKTGNDTGIKEKSRAIECEEKLIYSDGANLSWKTDPVVRMKFLIFTSAG